MPKDILVKLDELKAISPRVADYIDNQLYLTDYSQDEITEDILLIECTTILVEELRDIGIIIYADAESIYNDGHNRDLIAMLRQWIDYDRMVSYFTGNTSLKQIISDQVHADAPADDLIVRILEIINERSPAQPIVSQLIELTDKINNNNDFVRYMSGILDSLQDQDLPEIEDLEQFEKFAEYMEDHLAKVAKYTEQILLESPELNKAVLRQRLRVHDRDKMATNVVNIYTWAYHLEEANPPIELEGHAKEMFEDYDMRHHESNYHHWEFYKAHPDHVMTKEDVVDMVVDAAAKSETVDAFKDRMLKISTNLVLTPEQAQWFVTYAQILYPGE